MTHKISQNNQRKVGKSTNYCQKHIKRHHGNYEIIRLIYGNFAFLDFPPIFCSIFTLLTVPFNALAIFK